MITREDYYREHKKTAANSEDLSLSSLSVFPKEGIYIGDFVSASGNTAPALIPIEKSNGLCFLTSKENEKQVKITMQMIALRLACSLQTGLCKMILYDGENVGSELIQLANLNPAIIGNGIIDNPQELYNKLEEVRKNISYTIQKVLGASFADKTLIDYNQTAGELAKPYTFIVISDFPHTIDKKTAALLLQIIKTGRRAGVHVLMNMDIDMGLGGNGYDAIDQRLFLDTMSIVYPSNGRYYIKNLFQDKAIEHLVNTLSLQLDSTLPNNIESVKAKIDERFSQLSSAKLDITTEFTDSTLWSKTSDNGFCVPIGKINSSKLQNLELSIEGGGKQSYHHCLIGGATGSGKTVLLHNIICNTAWLYSPNEVQFILLDFKEGTEFVIYKDLPHVKILSIKSELEFAENVFSYLQGEMERRGELFKSNGITAVQNFHDYNNLPGIDRLPRLLVIVDEFQKLFEDFNEADVFKSLVSDLGKRGRSFGINMIFSTQALGGVNVGSALGEFGLRISMQLNSEMECSRILGQGNFVPRSFSKKGESVYCPGGVEINNSLYQVAYLSDAKIKDVLFSLEERFKNSEQQHKFPRYIFDGDSPTDCSDNKLYPKTVSPVSGKLSVFLGAPYALEDEHTSYIIQRENGYNVLIVGQDVLSSVSIMYRSLEQVIRQSTGESKIIICDKLSDESPFANKLKEFIEYGEKVWYGKEDERISQAIEKVYQELLSRKEGKGNYPRFLLALYNVYNFRPSRIRSEMVAPITKKLIEILRDGPEFGIHTICFVDSYKHYLDVFGPRILSEWRIKIEVKGGDGYKIFGKNMQSKSNISSSYTANVHTAEMEEDEVKKVKLYKI